MYEWTVLNAKAAQLIEVARVRGVRLASVESCTGGLIMASLTEIAGASAVVEGGFVTYANRAKIAAAGVPDSLLERYGAVSREAAIAMAEGGLRRLSVDLVISVTGIAGPGGATPTRPVGLVHFAIARKDLPVSARKQYFGNPGRDKVRLSAVAFALDFVLEQVQSACQAGEKS